MLVTSSVDQSVRGVLTIAIGAPVYRAMASAIYRSFRKWNVGNGIQFAIATDNPAHLPNDVKSNATIVALVPGQYGSGFSPKLYVDEITPFDRTLFVDADCLCVGSVDQAFEKFAGNDVSVIGRMISDGEWFGDVQSICERYGIPALPRFNGGVYYHERGDMAAAVYNTARKLEKEYDEAGFARLRGSANDEVLMAVAMAIHGQEPIPEDGTIMNSTLAGPGGVEIDALRGQARLLNPRAHPRHNSWYHMDEMRPVLVHFLGSETVTYPYRREEIRLEKVVARGWPESLAKSWAALSFTLPWRAKEATRNLLRPAYHRLFGVRPVRHNASGRL